MVLFTLLDLSLQTSWWVTKKIYYAGKYMIYGSQKTESEIREEKVEAKLDELLKHESELLKHEEEMMKHERFLIETLKTTRPQPHCELLRSSCEKKSIRHSL